MTPVPAMDDDRTAEWMCISLLLVRERDTAWAPSFQWHSHVHAPSLQSHSASSCCAGVYAKGGPTTVDKKITLASLTDRTTAEKGMVHT